MTTATNSWIHPTTGATRYYIDFEEWETAAGITTDYNGARHMPAAKGVPSKKVSRATLSKLRGFKVWADENGKITVDNFTNFYNFGVEDAEEFAQNLENYITANGGLDFMAAKASKVEEVVAETPAAEVTEVEAPAADVVAAEAPAPRTITRVEAERTYTTGQIITLGGTQWAVKQERKHFIDSDAPSIYGSHLLGAEYSWGWAYTMEEA